MFLLLFFTETKENRQGGVFPARQNTWYGPDVITYAVHDDVYLDEVTSLLFKTKSKWVGKIWFPSKSHISHLTMAICHKAI